MYAQKPGAELFPCAKRINNKINIYIYIKTDFSEKSYVASEGGGY